MSFNFHIPLLYIYKGNELSGKCGKKLCIHFYEFCMFIEHVPLSKKGVIMRSSIKHIYYIVLILLKALNIISMILLNKK